MLEEVMDDSSSHVIIVAKNRQQFDYMVRMMYDVLGFEGEYDRVRNVLIRKDGRRITFTTPVDNKRQRFYGTVYKDHAV